MRHYKLFYFDLKSKAEVIRLVFRAAGEPYEDVRLDSKEWARMKPDMPFLQIPVLEVSETDDYNGATTTAFYRLAQSKTIVKFLANRFNLAGENEMDRTLADMITEEIVDTNVILNNIYKLPNGEKKRDALRDAMHGQVLTNLTCIQNLLEANKHGGGYLVGKSLTYADLHLLYFYEWLKDYKSEILAKLPLLKEHEKKISELPRIAEHLSKHAHVKTAKIF
jgi:glutathione S-transferase